MKSAFYGNISKALDEAKKMALRSCSEYKIIDAQEADLGSSRLEILSTPLFGNNPAIIIRGALGSKSLSESVVSSWIDFLLSDELKDKQILLADQDVSSPVQKKLAKVFEFKKLDLEQKPKSDFFDSVLVNALAKKDKKSLWLRFRQAAKEGKRSEELFGMLIWQVKAILIVKKSENLKESGLSPFVYKNALSFSKSWTTDEAEKVLLSLVLFYHAPRVRGGESETYLEQVILRCF